MLLSGLVLIVLGIVGVVVDVPKPLDQHDQLITGGSVVAIVIGGVLVLRHVREELSTAASISLAGIALLVSEGIATWLPEGLRPWVLPLVSAIVVVAVLFALFDFAYDSLFIFGMFMAGFGVVVFVTDFFLDLGGWDPALNVLGTALVTAAPIYLFAEAHQDDREGTNVYAGAAAAAASVAVAITSVVAVNVFDLWTWAHVVLVVVSVLGFIGGAFGALYAIGSLPSSAPPAPEASLARLRDQPDGAYRLLPRI